MIRVRVAVRIGLEDDGQGGDVLVARRYLQGGYLTVVAQRGVPNSSADTSLPPDAVGGRPHRPGGKPALTAAFLSPEQVAALAGNPAMLP